MLSSAFKQALQLHLSTLLPMLCTLPAARGGSSEEAAWGEAVAALASPRGEVRAAVFKCLLKAQRVGRCAFVPREEPALRAVLAQHAQHETHRKALRRCMELLCMLGPGPDSEATIAERGGATAALHSVAAQQAKHGTDIATRLAATRVSAQLLSQRLHQLHASTAGSAGTAADRLASADAATDAANVHARALGGVVAEGSLQAHAAELLGVLWEVCDPGQGEDERLAAVEALEASGVAV
jgi:hypothetical protein